MSSFDVIVVVIWLYLTMIYGSADNNFDLLGNWCNVFYVIFGFMLWRKTPWPYCLSFTEMTQLDVHFGKWSPLFWMWESGICCSFRVGENECTVIFFRMDTLAEKFRFWITIHCLSKFRHCCPFWSFCIASIPFSIGL